MEERTGIGICPGIAIGRIGFYTKDSPLIFRKEIKDTAAEFARYETAKEKAREKLQELYEQAAVRMGEEGAEIIRAQRMMLEDPGFDDFVSSMILREKVNAEYAVKVTGDHFAELFAAMEDGYFQARGADVRDVTEQLLSALAGGKAGQEPERRSGPPEQEALIFMSEDLTPSEAVQLDVSGLSAIVTRKGSVHSHTAILARTLGIPALVQTEIHRAWDGRLAIVDGTEGRLIVDPEPEILRAYEGRGAADAGEREQLQALKGKETVTRSGQRISLRANIGSLRDVSGALDNDAEGIGLFRSEFLYLESDTYPSEEQQFTVYKSVLESMGDKKVIIRTLDIGADKKADYFQLESEENPAMGYRAIRICLDRTELFKTQLRALFRASAYGHLAIMYPMIISLEEVSKIRRISQEVKEALLAEGVKIGRVEEGIMIETPAAALISEELAAEVDFFSIGTNDLTQYTLAIDRQNARLASYYDPHHPAVLRLIRMIVEKAHRVGIQVGVCGDLAADLSLTETFVEIGVDGLSVPPGMILPLREKIRELE